MTPGATLEEQGQYGQSLLKLSGVSEQDVHVVQALDLSGTFVVQTPLDVSQEVLTAELQRVPNFVYLYCVCDSRRSNRRGGKRLRRLQW